MIRKAEQKIEEIVRVILTRTGLWMHSLSLYDGSSGVILFLLYYNQFVSRKYEPQIEEYIDQFVEKLSIYTGKYTYCDGLSGILYVLSFLREKNMLDIDLSDTEPIFETTMYTCIQMDMEKSYFDFMHGVVGGGLYFLKMNREEPVKGILDFLYATAGKQNGPIYKWASQQYHPEDKIRYSIALSHGCSGIALFLSRILRNEQIRVDKNRCADLLTGCVQYLLSQKFKEPAVSVFPAEFLEDPIPSRLAWCYGDLGVALAVYYAGKALNRTDWIEEGTGILRATTKRIRPEETLVNDAGICHGAAGIAMIYNRMYIETGEECFLQATEYWINQTLQFDVHADGLAGYKTHFNKKRKVNDCSLLTGITGIGLVLLSYVKRDRQEWDELFLLS
ncbi:MAG: lanthionine synthetase C family protein [Tannerellaceae bacterium]|nr:lanthionine synthetase C family protein [Tannerellaceae bacterium]